MDQLSTAYSNQGHYQRTERQIYKEPKNITLKCNTSNAPENYSADLIIRITQSSKKGLNIPVNTFTIYQT